MAKILGKWAMSLRGRLLVMILAPTAAVLVGSFVLAIDKTTDLVASEAELYVHEVAQKHANEVSAELNSIMATTRALAAGFEKTVALGDAGRDQAMELFLRGNLEGDARILAMWCYYELAAINPAFHQGHINNIFYSVDGAVHFSRDSVEMDRDNINGLYYKLKTAGRAAITEPYLYSYEGSDRRILETSICAPLQHRGAFAGLLGMDLSLDALAQTVSAIRPYDGSYAFLTSNQGVFVAHADTALVGRSIIDENPADDKKYNFGAAIRSGRTLAYYRDNRDGSQSYVCFAPVAVDGCDTPWSLGVAVPSQAMRAAAARVVREGSLISIAGVIMLLLIIFSIAHSISSPLSRLSREIGRLALGDVEGGGEGGEIAARGDEIGQIAQAVGQLEAGMRRMSAFAKEVGRGNLEAEYQQLSADDTLGGALLEMRESLVKARGEEQARHQEEEDQRWLNEGVTRVNDALRANDGDAARHGYEVLKTIADYAGANQGVLFVATGGHDDNGGDREYAALAALAWGRQRSIRKAYRTGESLVGRCAFERETIYLTQVPQDYVNITTGLGSASPTALLLAPLAMGDQVLGVLELASLEPMSRLQIEFVERVSYSLASTLASKEVNDRTARLLAQTKRQADEMAQQQEELRQNLEEMASTQEDFGVRQAAADSLAQAVDAIAYAAHFDPRGNILQANDNYAALLDTPRAQLQGHPLAAFGGAAGEPEEMPSAEIWDTLARGRSVVATRVYHTPQGDKRIRESYRPVTDTDGNLRQSVCVGFEIAAE